MRSEDTRMRVSTALHGPAQSLLMTLYARAIEHEHPHAVLRDDMAIEISEKLDYDFEAYFDPQNRAHRTVVIRTRLFDDAAQAHIDKIPDATIVNLGVGLDTRFYRLSNRQSYWIELDLPEVIDIRKQVVPTPPAERHQYIPKDVRDLSWMQEIPRDNTSLLFIAEGMFMYLTREEVQRILTAMADHFPGSQILFDVFTPTVIKLRNRHEDPLANLEAQMQWGETHPQVVESWDPRFQLVDTWSVVATPQYRKRMGRYAMTPLIATLVSKRLDIKVAWMRFN